MSVRTTNHSTVLLADYYLDERRRDVLAFVENTPEMMLFIARFDNKWYLDLVLEVDEDAS
jgi:hypothetical protein